MRHGLYSGVLVYVNISEEAKVNLAELVGNTILYAWKDWVYSKGLVDLVWENTGKGINKLRCFTAEYTVIKRNVGLL
jgi:hypothetical protein